MTNVGPVHKRQCKMSQDNCRLTEELEVTGDGAPERLIKTFQLRKAEKRKPPGQSIDKNCVPFQEQNK